MSVTLPNVRFTTTTDGVDIGYWEIGSGPALLLAQNRSLSHAELEWAVPSMSALYLELATRAVLGARQLAVGKGFEFQFLTPWGLSLGMDANGSDMKAGKSRQGHADQRFSAHNERWAMHSVDPGLQQ